VDLAGKQKILLDSIDTWLFIQPSLVNSCAAAARLSR
jgi:hypothetical protein